MRKRLVAASISMVVARRIFDKRTYCSTNEFIEWGSSWLNNCQQNVPAFYVNSNSVKVLQSPQQFFEELKSRSLKAKKRITLASLYLGNGDKEKELVECIRETMKRQTVPVNVLLEYTRGSRGSKSSRTLLLPLKQEFSAATNIALFHTPNLRGLLKRLVPARFDETINVTHLKVYLFDDSLILSGANLSEDYFTNRQDRYVLFENCREICNYFDDLVQTISSFSFSLKENNEVEAPPVHPFKASKKKFNAFATRQLNEFIDRHAKYDTLSHRLATICNRDAKNVETLNKDRYKNELAKSNESSTRELLKHIKNTCNSKVNDTVVFPLLQMKTMGVTADETVTRNILETTPPGANMTLATAYFNLTEAYWGALMKNKAQVNIIMAHPKAMGFYNAPGLAGGIPNAYSLIANRRFKHLLSLDQNERVKFLEFHRNAWTFHGKGLWVTLSHDDNSPLLTLIGSPNFGKRSVERDMEAQVGIVTCNDRLKRSFIEEKNRMLHDSTQVTLDTYREHDRKVYWWVFLIGTLMNELF